MNCKEARPLLLAYANDEVTRSERELLRKHLSQCAACSAEWNHVTGLTRVVRAGLSRVANAARPSRNAWQQLHGSLYSTQPPRSPGALLHMQRLASSALGAMVVVAGLIGGARVPDVLVPQPTIVPAERTAATSIQGLPTLLRLNMDLPAFIQREIAPEDDELLLLKREWRLQRAQTAMEQQTPAISPVDPRQQELDDDLARGPRRLRRAEGAA